MSMPGIGGRRGRPGRGRQTRLTNNKSTTISTIKSMASSNRQPKTLSKTGPAPIKGGLSPRIGNKTTKSIGQPLDIISSNRNIRKGANLNTSSEGNDSVRGSSSTVTLGSSGGRISPKSGRSLEFNNGLNATSLNSRKKNRNKPKTLSPRLDDLSPRSDASSKPRSPTNGLKPVSAIRRPSPKNSKIKLSSSFGRSNSLSPRDPLPPTNSKRPTKKCNANNSEAVRPGGIPNGGRPRHRGRPSNKEPMPPPKEKEDDEEEEAEAEDSISRSSNMNKPRRPPPKTKPTLLDIANDVSSENESEGGVDVQSNTNSLRPTKPPFRNRKGESNYKAAENKPKHPVPPLDSSLFDIADEEHAKQKQKTPQHPSRPRHPQKSSKNKGHPPLKKKKSLLQEIAADISDDEDEASVKPRRPDPVKKNTIAISPRSRISTSKLKDIAQQIDEEEGTFTQNHSSFTKPSKPLAKKNRGSRPIPQAVELTTSPDSITSKFIRAAYKGHITKIHKYLREGVDVNCTDRHGWTALHWASSKGDLDIIEKLVMNEADVNCADHLNGWTPLHLAAINGQNDAATYLIEQGGEIDIVDKYGDMPKHCVKNIRRNGDLFTILSKRRTHHDEIDVSSSEEDEDGYDKDDFEG
jgi:hypothetical protein